jgi:ubiquinone/menaquinone biosynthesis C-methylase UbiE
MHTNIYGHACSLKQLKLLNIFVLCVIAGSINAAENRGKFDPESNPFSKMETIKLWTATRFHDDHEFMMHIQNEIAKRVMNNRDSYNYIEPVVQDVGEQRLFGKSLGHFYQIELPCLQEIHEISLRKDVKALELSAGNGKFSRLIPLAVEKRGDFWINDLSPIMVKKAMDCISALVPADLMNMVHPLPGDCLKIEYPGLDEQVDVISCSNLRHFLNPEQDQQLLENAGKLLTKGGKIFLMANTIGLGSDTKGTKVFDLYIKQKTRPYAGFMKTISKWTLERRTQFPLKSPEVLVALPIPSNTYCSTNNLDLLYKTVPFVDGSWREIAMFTQEHVGQFFTPSIDRMAVELYNKRNEGRGSHLTIEDTFFMDVNKDERYAEFKPDQGMNFAATIIRKD